MKPTDLSQLGKQHKEREINKRTEEITKIADSYLKDLLKEEILIGELERVANYIQAKITQRIDEHKENTYISRINGEK